MKLKLCTTTDAENVIGKTVATVKEIDIRPRGLTDLIEPVLTLRGLEFQGDYNYAVLTLERERFYFIRQVEPLGGDLFRVNLELDTLETYKTEALNSVGRFKRNLKEGDFVSSGFEEAATKTVTAVLSDKEVPAGQTMILTTVGG